MLKRFLAFLARATADHPALVLILAAAVSVPAALAARSMPIDATFTGILNEDDPEARRFEEISRSFGGSGSLLLLVESESGLEAAKAFVAELEPRLMAPDFAAWVKAVDGRLIDPDRPLPAGVVPLPPASLEALAEAAAREPEAAADFRRAPGLRPFIRWVPERLLRAAAEGGVEMSAPVDEGSLDAIALVTGALEDAASGRRASPGAALAAALTGQSGAAAASWESKYLRDGWVVSPDGRALLVMIRLKIDVLATAIGVDSFAVIDAATQEVAARYPGLTARYAGAFAYGYEDQQNVLERTRLLSGLSLVLVLALFFFIDRSLFGPLIVGIPLLLGTLWTFGLVWVFIGYVSLTSAVFGILLFGLGVDFAIHIVVRYNDARAEGAEHRAALEEAMVLTGHGVVTGALTSAVAFLGLLVTEQKAARHLGITTGVGLLCCLVAMLTVLPALLTLTRRLKRVSATKASMRIPLLEAWVAFVLRRPRAVLAGASLLAIGGAAVLPLARFEYNVEKIATDGTQALAVKKRIETLFETSSEFALCVCEDLAETRATAARIRERGQFTARVESITDYLPADPAACEAAIARLGSAIAALPPGAPPPPRPFAAEDALALGSALGRLEAAARLRLLAGGAGAARLGPLIRRWAALRAAIAADPARAAAGLGALDSWLAERSRAMLTPLAKGRARPLGVEDLPAAVRDKFVDERGRYFVLAYPKESMLDGGNIFHFFKDLEGLARVSTGLGKIVYLLVNRSLEDMPLLITVVGMLVLAVIALDLRSGWWAALVFLPLLYASLIAVGLVIVSDQVISILMLAGFPLILGIGVDDGVHLVHRVLEDPAGGIAAAVSETGKAILMTSITTMVSFGGMLLMNHHGLFGLGFLVTTGVGLCFLCSVTVFPAALALAARWRLERESRPRHSPGSSLE